MFCAGVEQFGTLGKEPWTAVGRAGSWPLFAVCGSVRPSVRHWINLKYDLMICFDLCTEVPWRVETKPGRRPISWPLIRLIRHELSYRRKACRDKISRGNGRQWGLPVMSSIQTFRYWQTVFRYVFAFCSGETLCTRLLLNQLISWFWNGFSWFWLDHSNYMLECARTHSTRHSMVVAGQPGPTFMLETWKS